MSDELMNRARELLAEVERLTEALKAQLEANVSVSNHAVAETRRAIRAEARLRELASAEPVAYVDAGENAIEWRATEWHNIPLIRCPEMPS